MLNNISLSKSGALNLSEFVSKTKPTVKYDVMAITRIEVGKRADVYGIDHPLLGSQWINTSAVLNYDKETGVFETWNTIYVPNVDEE